MKKIISLVLALVMVFAIAASASALTGTIIDPATTSTSGVLPYTNIKLKLVEAIPGEVAFSLLSLTEVAAGRAYYTNQAIYFALEYTTPAAATITVAPEDFGDPAVLISSTNVEFWAGTFALYSITPATIEKVPAPTAFATVGTNSYKVQGSDIPKPVAAAVQFVLVGGGIVRGTASGAIRADFAGNIDCIKFALPAPTATNLLDIIEDAADQIGVTDEIIYNGLKPAYVVSMTGDETTDPSYIVGVYNAAGAALTGQVEFFTELDDTKAGSTKNVTKIEATLLPGGDVYLVNDTGVDISGGGSSSLQFYRDNGGTLEVLSSGDAASTYGQLKALYQGVMNKFGLVYSAKGILLPNHFAAKFSDFYAKSNEVKVALSTAVATDPDLELPPTGDAATTAGFVMIALAIVAACGLAYRKVRG